MQPTQSSTPSDPKHQTLVGDTSNNIKSSYLFKEYHALKNEFKNTNITNINRHYLHHQRNSPLLESASQQLISMTKNSDGFSRKHSNHAIMSKRIQTFIQDTNGENRVDHMQFNMLVREQQDQIRVTKKRHEHQNSGGEQHMAGRPPKSK